MKKTLITLVFMLLPFASMFAQNQEAPLADQLESMLKTESFQVGILLQAIADFSFKDDDFNGGRRFRPGATRLSLRGVVDQDFDYRLQLDFRRSPSVMDAYVGYTFSEQLRVRAGAQKPALSADLDPPPGETDFINRARLVGTMMNPREIGVSFLGKIDRFNYHLGIYNGYGLSFDNDNRFFYTARLEYILVEKETSSLEAGLNGAINRSRLEPVGNTGRLASGNRTFYGAFVKYNDEAWFGTVEFLQTRFEFDIDEVDEEIIRKEETITGFYATLGHRVTQKSEILARWDHLSFDLFTDSSELFILGWTHQATRLISFQVNLLGRFEEKKDDQFGMSGKMQFYWLYVDLCG